MKQIGKTSLFWSGLTLMNTLFFMVILWSLLPFGGNTLPHTMEQLWNIPFPSSALLVSLFCALLGTAIMVLMNFHPAAVALATVEHGLKRPQE
jgi:hypothetical protein